MRTFKGLIALLGLIFATFLIQNVNSAAVMSIDIGSEWMKVSNTLSSNEIFMKHIRVLMLILGWNRITGKAYGDSTEQGIKAKDTIGHCFP